jgi:hypothetical protein
VGLFSVLSATVKPLTRAITTSLGMNDHISTGDFPTPLSSTDIFPLFPTSFHVLICMNSRSPDNTKRLTPITICNTPITPSSFRYLQQLLLTPTKPNGHGIANRLSSGFTFSFAFSFALFSWQKSSQLTYNTKYTRLHHFTNTNTTHHHANEMPHRQTQG